MPLYFSSEDITKATTDAIVNAANTLLRNYALRRGGGVCGAIFRAAGHAQMQAACNRIGGCETGKAVITEGFALPARYVIHAVGPEYKPGDLDQRALLRESYLSALDIAMKHQLHSVTFPLISSGIYGYPKEEALEIALDAIGDFLRDSGDALEVTLCLMDSGLLRDAQDWAARRGGEGTEQTGKL
ncbi:MAG: macro domain-containing protein [Clostridia bacterium]|nr:macro domain-containing protein [Clostridia bacterium]